MQAVSTFGQELRRWRTQRRLSQLELATAAEVSQRHLSFLENGRSTPSPEMVLHLGRSLELSLRDQNALLLAAGFAPAYAERGLDDPDLSHVRAVLERLLDSFGPYPAYVIDRGWDLVMANESAVRLIGLIEPVPPPTVAANVMRLMLHPDGLRHAIVDWETAAGVLLDRLRRERLHRPADERLAALHDEVSDYCDLPATSLRPSVPDGSELVLPLSFRSGENVLRFYTSIATIGAAFDITLEELRIELLLPADAETAEHLRTMSAPPPRRRE